ncbi:MAG: PD-(D/E)XK nuclease domain-containing protein [Myxococcota bacterium]
MTDEAFVCRTPLANRMTTRYDTSNADLERAAAALRAGRLRQYFEHIEAIIAGIPYHPLPRKSATNGGDSKQAALSEGFYHTAFHLINECERLDARAEVATHHGRIDEVIRTRNRVYIFELKKDASAQAAVRQMKETKTFKPYLEEDQYGRKPVTLVGASFKRFRSDGEIDWAFEELNHSDLDL